MERDQFGLDMLRGYLVKRTAATECGADSGGVSGCGDLYGDCHPIHDQRCGVVRLWLRWQDRGAPNRGACDGGV